MSAAREAALEALERCRRDRAWSGASIDAALKKAALDARDGALASRLCLGVLQNSALCDYYVNFYYDRAPSTLEPKLRDLLRMGVYQLLFLDKIPARAAVNESVELCRAIDRPKAAGLVNAVLRRVAEHRDALPEIPGEGTAEYLSVKYSHPLWLARELVELKGYAFTRDFFEADNRPGGLTIQVNTLRVRPEDYVRSLERRGIGYETFAGLPGCIRLEGGGVTALPGYEEGLFYVQDRAARAAVAMAGPEPGMTVLDACAAPGGKSFAAALAMGNRGSILSRDIQEKKLGLIRSGAERLGIGIIRTRTGDARTYEPELKEAFDLVLADVPCSGMGVAGKRPEIRYKTQEEIAPLPALQGAILQNLAEYVRPGGVLLYSTCTILPRENEERTRAFLEADGRFEPEEMHTFWPNIDGTDGFFAAKLRRKHG